MDRTLTSVWRAVNGVKIGKRSDKAAVSYRAEKGLRIGDLEYSNDLLDLGMLKGNKFTITLRCVCMADDIGLLSEVSSLDEMRRLIVYFRP